MTLRGALSEAWCAAMKASYTCMSWVNIETACSLVGEHASDVITPAKRSDLVACRWW